MEFTLKGHTSQPRVKPSPIWAFTDVECHMSRKRFRIKQAVQNAQWPLVPAYFIGQPDWWIRRIRHEGQNSHKYLLIRNFSFENVRTIYTDDDFNFPETSRHHFRFGILSFDTPNRSKTRNPKYSKQDILGKPTKFLRWLANASSPCVVNSHRLACHSIDQSILTDRVRRTDMLERKAVTTLTDDGRISPRLLQVYHLFVFPSFAGQGSARPIAPTPFTSGCGSAAAPRLRTHRPSADCRRRDKAQVCKCGGRSVTANLSLQSIEKGREIANSAVAFHPMIENAGGPLPFPRTSVRSSFIRYPVPFRETGNAPVPPLELRVSMGIGDHLFFDSSPPRLLLKYDIKKGTGFNILEDTTAGKLISF
ncbi:hypothetical protein EVAR_93814_1 [Eumeta japonica]|uniref:Uncharacterized protein n=1 Tax=Eumeta variegata TaxID=151549 RepID=A0A4C1VB81_EUMVA|nr:hypothetical protein EVAR_93814_1 [Eumeta japonica]